MFRSKKDAQRNKKQKIHREESSRPQRQPPTPLTMEQRNRALVLNMRRTLAPSRWIDTETITELGLYNSVKLLTERLGLWDFLCDEVPTYHGITIEFLTSLEFNRSTRVLTFNLGDQAHQMDSTELMTILGLSTENIYETRASTDFHPDMSESHFRGLICQDGILNHQRAKNIVHPTLRYIQRILAYTIFGRGETASVIRLNELFYLCCMLRRNEGEMRFMPHLGYNLAKHLYLMATNTQANGIIIVGGIITKIVKGLNIELGNDVVQGPTNIDINGLVAMRLIERSQYDDCWVNVGPDVTRHKLPLQVDIDPTLQHTWRILDPPLGQAEPVQQPPQPNQQHAHAVQQEGPTNQQLMDYMMGLGAQIGGVATTMTGMSQTMDGVVNTLNNMHIHVRRTNERLDALETDAQLASYYSRNACFNSDPGFQDDPPTPPHQRRSGREAERAAMEAARQAARQAEEEQGEDMDEDEEDEEENDPSR